MSSRLCVDPSVPPWCDMPLCNDVEPAAVTVKRSPVSPLNAFESRTACCQSRREALAWAKCDELEVRLAEREAQLSEQKRLVEETRLALALQARNRETETDKLRNELREAQASEKVSARIQRRWSRERAVMQGHIGKLEARIESLEREVVEMNGVSQNEKRRFETTLAQTHNKAQVAKARLRAAMQSALDQKDRELRAVRAEAEAEVVRLSEARDAAIAASAAVSAQIDQSDNGSWHKPRVSLVDSPRSSSTSKGRPRRPPPAPPVEFIRQTPSPTSNLPHDADLWLESYDLQPHALTVLAALSPNGDAKLSPPAACNTFRR